VASTARTEPAGRAQDVHVGKALDQLPFQQPVALIDVNPDLGRLGVAAENPLQHGNDRRSPVVGGDDDGNGRFYGHTDSNGQTNQRARLRSRALARNGAFTHGLSSRGVRRLLLCRSISLILINEQRGAS